LEQLIFKNFEDPLTSSLESFNTQFGLQEFSKNGKMEKLCKNILEPVAILLKSKVIKERKTTDVFAEEV